MGRRLVGRAALAVGLAMVAVACGGKGDTSDTVDASTTVASTTTTSPQASTTLPSSSTVPRDTRFEPACVDRDATDADVPADDPALGMLSPLGAEPVVQLELPRMSQDQPSADVNDWVRPAVTPIRGGMLVALRPYDGLAESGIIVAINANGTIRWQRCVQPIPDIVRVAPGGEADEVLVGWSTYLENQKFQYRFEVWSLAQGVPSRSWDSVLSDSNIDADAAEHLTGLVDSNPNYLVLGAEDERVIELSDSVLVVDLATMNVREVAYPAFAQGRPLGLPMTVTDDGRLVMYASDADNRAEAVETPDGWSTDIVDIEAVVGPRVVFSFESSDGPETLTAYDSQGGELWRRDDVFAVPSEGFRTLVDEGSALVRGCSGAPDFEGDWCPGPKLLGIDPLTGRTLWAREGSWAVSVIDDGVAMVAGPFVEASNTSMPPPSPPWILIDLASGQQIGDNTWGQPWHFGIGCCDEPARASVGAGVVITVDEDSIEMWYPESASTPLQRVSLR